VEIKDGSKGLDILTIDLTHTFKFQTLPCHNYCKLAILIKIENLLYSCWVLNIIKITGQIPKYGGLYESLRIVILKYLTLLSEKIENQ
jgi:hypothetical protein